MDRGAVGIPKTGMASAALGRPSQRTDRRVSNIEGAAISHEASPASKASQGPCEFRCRLHQPQSHNVPHRPPLAAIWRSSMFLTVIAAQLPPRAVDMPLAFSAASNGGPRGAEWHRPFANRFGNNNLALGYSENNSGTGGTLSVSNGANTANFALLGNYMASSMVAFNRRPWWHCHQRGFAIHEPANATSPSAYPHTSILPLSSDFRSTATSL
jgi:hypothetical protein